jgi:nicotinamide-nucleotide amidase
MNNITIDNSKTIFPADLLSIAADVLSKAKAANARIATAETVTSGLASACLTSVPGASEVFERGYILYHSSAKSSGLGVDEVLAERYGAVSAEVTLGLAKGLLNHSQAFAAVAITGYAGPGGGNDKNPVGTIFVAAASRDGKVIEERRVFDGHRDNVRLQAIEIALKNLKAIF